MRERDIYYPIFSERPADCIREPADAEQLPYGHAPTGTTISGRKSANSRKR